MNNFKNYKAIIVSVGGNIEPIIYTLNQYKTDYVLFFTSKESNLYINDIIKYLNYKLKHYIIETDDSDDLLKCYEIVKNELKKYIEKLKLEKNEIMINYTGGTKTMSVALVLASIDLGFNFSYVSGLERDKNGVGIVKSGKEIIKEFINPYDYYNEDLRSDFKLYFNNCNFQNALYIIDKIINNILSISKNEKERMFYENFKYIIEGYKYWDLFDHKSAKDKIYKGLNKLELYLKSKDEKLLDNIKENLSYLEDLLNKKGNYLVYDLIANADRRANFEGRYDDAVARLYRALEKIAQNELLDKYYIKTSKILINEIPDELKDKFKKYYEKEGNCYKLPLYASFELLYYKDKNNKIGKKFMENYEKRLKDILQKRNSSILAHGESPVDKEIYENLRSILLDFIGEEIQIPKFPEIKNEIFVI